MDWKLIQCAVEGRRHTAMHIPCQDKVKIVSADNLWIGALSDGAGSASHSHYGAQCVVDTVCELISSSFDKLFDMQDAAKAKALIVTEIVSALNDIALTLEVEIKELAATLLFVAVKGNHMLIGHIGDGVICYQKDGVLKVASKPTNGEFANSTVFVTSTAAQNTMRLIKGELSSISGFCLMSDGSAASLYNRTRNTPMPVLSKLLRLRSVMATRPLQKLLDDSFKESVVMGTQDDCSIVLMALSATNIPANDVLSDDDLADLLGLSEIPVQRARQITRYRQIIALAANQISLKAISLAIHVKPKYAKRYVKRLLDLNLLSSIGSTFVANVVE